MNSARLIDQKDQTMLLDEWDNCWLLDLVLKQEQQVLLLREGRSRFAPPLQNKYERVAASFPTTAIRGETSTTIRAVAKVFTTYFNLMNEIYLYCCFGPLPVLKLPAGPF
jgi:hypothetical protein